MLDSERIIGMPILSLHTGVAIAQISEIIVDPDSLKVIAYRVENFLPDEKQQIILAFDSVREISKLGLIIDSSDELMEQGDILRVAEVIELGFQMKGLKVVTRKKTRLGKVSSYVFDEVSGNILQIIVQKPVMKALIDPELVIPRSEIIEVDDYELTIKDEESKIRAAATQDFVPNFVNPFRQN